MKNTACLLIYLLFTTLQYYRKKAVYPFSSEASRLGRIFTQGLLLIFDGELRVNGRFVNIFFSSSLQHVMLPTGIMDRRF